MKPDMDTLLTNALSPKEEPNSRLNQTILEKANTQSASRRRPFRSAAAAVAILLILAAGSFTAIAAVRHYLSASQVVDLAFIDTGIIEAFESDDAIIINESQTCGGYTVTLLGMVSGEGLVEGDGMDYNESYLIVMLENADGSALTGGEPDILVSPYIHGYDPLTYNWFSMGGSGRSFLEEGVLYEVISCRNLECFADIGVYVGVSEYRYSKRIESFLFDEETGKISRNPDYDGLNALFELPLDPSKADNETAEKLIEYMENPTSEAYAELYLTGIEDEELKLWLAYLECHEVTLDYLEQHATVAETQTLIPDENDMVSYSYEVNGYSIDQNSHLNLPSYATWLYGVTSVFTVSDYECGDTVDSLIIETLTYNSDGTITMRVYVPK